MSLTKLFMIVVYLNALSLGAGGMMLAGLERELVGGGWITASQFAAGVAMGQSTPGPLVAFTTAIGNYALGLPGALVATAGLMTVSLMTVSLIRRVPAEWFRHPRVQGALNAVPPFVTALVLYLALRITMSGSAVNPVLPALVIAGVVVGRLKRVPAPALMIGAVAMGMLFQELW